MESKHLMIIGIISLFLLQNIILLEPQSHTNNNMDKIIFNNVSPSQLYYSYNISIHNSPTGNGYYQQLITLKNYSIYNINSNGSNFYVAYENNTLIYTWVQSINKTVISFWSKILNGTSIIKIDVYNNKTNLFSSGGHIGEAPQLSSTYAEYDNGKIVFDNQNDPLYSGSLYWNFLNSSNSYYGGSTTNVTVNDGYHVDGTLPGNIYGIIFSGNQFNATFYGLTNASSNNFIGMQTDGVSSAYFLINTNANKPFSVSLYEKDANGEYEYNNNSYLNAGSPFNDLTIYYVFATRTLTMPTFTQSTNQFYSLNIISKNNGTIINNSYIYNGLFYSNNYINFTVNYSKFSNFYVYALNYSTNFPQYTQFLLTINNYTDNNSGLYYFGTLTILYHTQSIKPLRETTFTQYNMYFLIVIIIFILGLIIYGYKRG